MITIHATPDDLVNMRFAYRPLLEIPLSYRTLINPDFQSFYGPWVDKSIHATHGADLHFLNALVPPCGYIPDFLTPTPTTKRLDIEADFTELQTTPDERIREDVRTLIEMHGGTELRQYFLTHPREALNCLIEEMRIYWHRALVHHWSQMISTLESDMLYRARRLALEGPGPLLEDLHSSIHYRDHQIQLAPHCQHRDHDLEFTLNGSGMQLVPVIFRGCGRMYQIDTAWPSMLVFGVHGTGLWHQKPPSKSLEMALGTARARVLQVLITPAATSEVAYKAHISTATASQHLKRLHKAGLVEPHRYGMRVYYRLTRRGEELITLFERIY